MLAFLILTNDHIWSQNKEIANYMTPLMDFFLFIILFILSGLECDLLHQLFLPVLRQQRVRHDCSALPVWGDQHRLLERPGCADRGALPLRQEVGRPRRPNTPWCLLVGTVAVPEWRVEWCHVGRPAAIGRLQGRNDIDISVAMCKALGCFVPMLHCNVTLAESNIWK